MGHCDFCGTWHSSMSCYHPGRAKYDAALTEIERLRKLEGTDDHPEHKCERCGGRNIVWHADNDLWNSIVNDRYSVLCPLCLAELVEEAGDAPTAWHLCQEAEIEPLRQFHNAVSDERLRLEQMEEDWEPGMPERRLADNLLDALEAAEAGGG